MQTNPARKNPNQTCEYHGIHGHRTEDCKQLREEITRLFNKGHLREFLSDRAKSHFISRDVSKQNEKEEPQHIIHMIIGGTDTPRGPMLKRTKTSMVREKRSRTQEYAPMGTLSFGDKDAEGVIQSHNDALVISVLVNKTKIKRVLIDPGSSTNIIRLKVVEQLGLQDRIVPATLVLNGFNMACETTKEEIALPINVAGTVQETKFHVIEGDMRYNALFGRPWIHNMRAVPSTLHQALKFPVSGDVKTVYGEQPATKEMFSVDEAKPMSSLSPIKGPGPEGERVTK
ncbi:uncharacterized protein [Nicotiana tomentosiformis]|uniref:uncharacterized protein n=1 Tax=Nicotiana tomentosiformis TaxID=4098 RepID=UPI00388CA8E1